MLDRYNREINYLRISVTDKCNLRCVYCMPEDGIPLKKHSDFLSFEQITEIVRQAVPLGISKIRLTGGEPLVKKGITDLVAMLASVEGIEHIGMTTNGVLLPRFAPELRRAGLSSVNVSLDTMDPDRYRYLTRIGTIENTIAGIKAAAEAGFPVKINAVIMDDTPDEDIQNLRGFCESVGAKLQMINHYSLKQNKKDNYIFERPPKCSVCNKIRLTADGYFKPCLHSNTEIPLDTGKIQACLIRTISLKPEHGGTCSNRNMVEIGG